MRTGTRPRRTLAAAALPLLLLTACTSAPEPPAQEDVVEVAIDGGDDTLVGTSPVRVAVPAGGTLRVRNANRGSTATHVLTSARPGEGPSLFTPVATGALPNHGVWGLCLGGVADATTRACPVAPVEGPREWDGTAYLSLGAQLPGETRDVSLADDLAAAGASLWCRVHPGLQVELVVGDASVPPLPVPATPSPSPAVPGRVVAAPADAQAELLAFVPATVRVRVGSPVTWSVPGTSPHTVEFGGEPELTHTGAAEALPDVPPGGMTAGALARSGFLSRDPGAPGSTFSLRFAEPGRYRYACRFHPQMTGEVVVVG